MFHYKDKLGLFVSAIASLYLLAFPIVNANAAVLVSVKPIGFIASAITDGVIPTEVLLPDGASPHTYALRPSDIERIRKADLVVWISPEMEAFMQKSMQQIPSKKQIVLAELPSIHKGLVKEEEHDDHGKDEDHHHDGHHHHGEYNLHIWMSPIFAKEIAIAIHDRLITLLPEKRSKLDDNLMNFEKGLQQTEDKLNKDLKPIQGKGYFVFHDAYTYFDEYFGLKPLGYFTVNPEIQPGAQRLHEIRKQLVEQKAMCVFAEPQFTPAVVKSIAQGTKVHIGTLDPLGMKIPLGKTSYFAFLSSLSQQFVSCLKR